MIIPWSNSQIFPSKNLSLPQKREKNRPTSSIWHNSLRSQFVLWDEGGLGCRVCIPHFCTMGRNKWVLTSSSCSRRYTNLSVGLLDTEQLTNEVT